MTDIIAMSQSCSKCGATVTNDDPDIRHPLEFIAALEARGWKIPRRGHGFSNEHRCPRCTNQ